MTPPHPSPEGRSPFQNYILNEMSVGLITPSCEEDQGGKSNENAVTCAYTPYLFRSMPKVTGQLVWTKYFIFLLRFSLACLTSEVLFLAHAFQLVLPLGTYKGPNAASKTSGPSSKRSSVLLFAFRIHLPNFVHHAFCQVACRVHLPQCRHRSGHPRRRCPRCCGSRRKGSPQAPCRSLSRRR
jgi:hypothetical protein